MSKKRKNKEKERAYAAAEAEQTEAVETPEDQSEQQIEEAELTVEQELEDLKQRLQRVSADYQNYQKRSYVQTAQAAKLAYEDMTRSLLPVLDDFERALGEGAETKDNEQLLKGVQMVYDHLLNVLKNAGMSNIEVAPGCDFNPSVHEAMLHEENDQFPPNSVVRELARGYTMNDRTLRPAKVSVAKAPVQPEEKEES